MDLPSCPSCRQSVLDDDAEVCPFCGAPLKGNAAGRSGAAPASRPSSASTARPTPKSTVGTASPGAAKTPAKPEISAKKPAGPSPASAEGLDDAFSVDLSAGKSAPAASRQ